MSYVIQNHRADRKSSLLILGVVILLALVGFHSVAQADILTLTVNTTADEVAGSCLQPMSECTLRDAILTANANQQFGFNSIIKFAIPGSGVHTIQLLQGPLPEITAPVVIDGTTQPGFTGIPLIELDGENLTAAGGERSGLLITAGNSTVRGLILNRFSTYGIHLKTKGGNTIVGNYIGTNSAGTDAQGNVAGGIFIDNVPKNRIGGADHDAGNCNHSCNLISGNTFFGVQINGASATQNVVQGNFIGTDVTGTIGLITGEGVEITAGATTNTIGGADHDGGVCNKSCNLISGNIKNGVAISGGATKNVVQGNFIGTDVTGTLKQGNGDLHNNFGGVSIGDSPSNTIGGADHDSGVCNKSCNLISGNVNDGVDISGSGSTKNQVLGNFIGTVATGQGALGNGFTGVRISGGDSNRIGGTDHDSGVCNKSCNLIAGNAGDGVSISGTANQVQGNFINSNLGSGVAFGDLAVNNKIGGTDHDSGICNRACNLISGNARSGVDMFGVGTSTTGNNVTGTQVQGNFIGMDKDGLCTELSSKGQCPVSNQEGGVFIRAGASSNTIGGTDSGAGNIIAFNNNGGVIIGSGDGPFSTSNAVLSNSIFSNGGLGIDLLPFGVTINDSRGHNGPNHFQNFPLLTSATSDGIGITITGTIHTLPAGGQPPASNTLRIEFFTNVLCNPSGAGEGAKFIGAESVTTDNNGNASFTAHASGSFNPGNVVTATATPILNNDTSEFSPCVTITSSSASSSSLKTDDGSFEQFIGFPNGAPTAQFVNRLAPLIALSTGSGALPQSVQIYFGSGLPAGTDITLLVGFNRTGSSTIDGIPFTRIPAKINLLNQWNVYDLTSQGLVPITSGDFVVGFEVNNPPNIFPAAEDTSSFSQGLSYLSPDGKSFNLVDKIAGLVGNFGIRATVDSVFVVGDICSNLTVSVKPSGSPKPVVFKPTAKKVAKQTFSVTVTNKTGIAQTVDSLDALLGEPFTIVSIKPALPRLIKNGQKQNFTVKTQRAAGLSTATATAPFFFTQTSCGLLTPAGLMAPADQLHMQTDEPGVASLRLQLYDLSGRELVDQSSEGSALSLPVTKDSGGALPNGVYLYVVSVRNSQGELIRTEVRKLVISR
ncbi:CSLREA domain-containing protein [Candidatus Acetothermia bacterium]|nr:CSLREA domain-containing protein [Candidatus Acetothermia bacterium]